MGWKECLEKLSNYKYFYEMGLILFCFWIGFVWEDWFINIFISYVLVYKFKWKINVINMNNMNI